MNATHPAAERYALFGADNKPLGVCRDRAAALSRLHELAGPHGELTVQPDRMSAYVGGDDSACAVAVAVETVAVLEACDWNQQGDEWLPFLLSRLGAAMLGVLSQDEERGGVRATYHYIAFDTRNMPPSRAYNHGRASGFVCSLLTAIDQAPPPIGSEPG